MSWKTWAMSCVAAAVIGIAVGLVHVGVTAQRAVAPAAAADAGLPAPGEPGRVRTAQPVRPAAEPVGGELDRSGTVAAAWPVPEVFAKAAADRNAKAAAELSAKATAARTAAQARAAKGGVDGKAKKSSRGG